MANYTFFGDEKLLLPRLTRESALGTYPKGNDVVILILRGLDDLKGHEDAGEPAPVVTGCLPGGLDRQQPGLGDGYVAHRLTLGGEVKLIFFVICVFGHVMPLQYATYACGGLAWQSPKDDNRRPSSLEMGYDIASQHSDAL